MNYNKWNKLKLGDLIESISIKHDFKKKELIFLNTSDVLEGKVLHQNYTKIDKMPGQAKKSIKKDDILFSEIRPKNKRFAYIDFDAEDYVVSTKLMVLRKKSPLIDNKFLYKLLTSDRMLNYLQHIAEGRSGTFPQITFSELKDIDILLPSINEQKAISKILSSLDEKIETNNKINKKLEEMAQAIFKHWFVDFEFPNEEGKPYKSSGGEMVESEMGMIPKGWETGRLEDVAKFYNGYAFKSKELLDEPDDDCYYVFKMGNIKKGGGLNKEGTKSYIKKDKCSNLNRYLVKKGDLLMCMTDMKANVALLGHTALMDEDDRFILNQRVGLLRVIDPERLDYSYLYLQTNNCDFIENIRSRANSGVQVNLSTKEIKESKLIIPSCEIHFLFNKVVKSLFKKKFNLDKQNENLIKLRDILLPKLMSGEIRVPID